MKFYFPLFILFIFHSSLDVSAGEVEDYLRQYRTSAVADYARETKIISGYSLEKLVAELDTFYMDTLASVRQKAREFTYRKGLQMPSGHRTMAVSRLVEGINDTDGGLVGQAIGYLRAFDPVDFNAEAQSVIRSKLRNIRMPHYGDLALLAGFAGIGKEELYQQYIQSGLPVRVKWNVALALARMGQADALDYCMKKIKKLPVNSELVSYGLPDLIYTRQKQAIAYCVELLQSDKNVCPSPNPDIPESISCAYRIMELLAPVIIDFPVQIDVSGTLDTDDYPKALQKVRAWLSKNPGYQISTTDY
jgi:hypothetical protein